MEQQVVYVVTRGTFPHLAADCPSGMDVLAISQRQQYRRQIVTKDSAAHGHLWMDLKSGRDARWSKGRYRREEIPEPDSV